MNQLTDRTADRIAALIRVTPSWHPVREVHLGHNRITTAGAVALFSAVRACGHYPRRLKGGNRVPLWVQLEFNSIDFASAQAEMRKLDLTACPARHRSACGAGVHNGSGATPQLHLYNFAAQATSLEGLLSTATTNSAAAPAAAAAASSASSSSSSATAAASGAAKDAPATPVWPSLGTRSTTGPNSAAAAAAAPAPTAAAPAAQAAPAPAPRPTKRDAQLTFIVPDASAVLAMARQQAEGAPLGLRWCVRNMAALRNSVRLVFTSGVMSRLAALRRGRSPTAPSGPPSGAGAGADNGASNGAVGKAVTNAEALQAACAQVSV